MAQKPPINFIGLH